MRIPSSMADYEVKIRGVIAGGNLDAGLKSVMQLVNLVFCEPINTGRVFGSKMLDDICQEIGAANWKKIKAETPATHNTGEKTTLYIASTLYASGGHTAVLADIIRLCPATKAIILLTGIAGKTDLAKIQKRFGAINNLQIEQAPQGSLHTKLDWLQRRILTVQPSDIWLFNHNHDSVAVAAVQPDAGYRLHFYHHGDHHLCLGVYLGYADHVDPHPMGYHNCRNTLGVSVNRYLPLVVKDFGDRPANMGFISGNGLTTCTAAGFNKLEIPYFIRYTDVIPNLLKAGGRHIHIGHLSPIALKRIASGMAKLNIPPSAFVYIPFVPSVWKALHEHKVDLYISSFPYGGGRTLIEVMGAGIPVAVHNHNALQILNLFEMAYNGVFEWRNPDDLYDFIKYVNADTLQKHSQLARKQYEDFHREDVLRQYLADTTQILNPITSCYVYRPDFLQQAVDISNQVTVKDAIRRWLYRLYRWQKAVRF